MFWPMLVSLSIMAIAYTLYRMLPEIIDYSMSFLWIVGGFLAVYIGAAIYLSWSLPALGSTGMQTKTENGAEIIQVEDIFSQ